MIALIFYMAHCVATFGLVGMQVQRVAVLRRVEDASESEREVLWRLHRVAGRFAMFGFLFAELITGLVLLTFSNWRESAFSLSMLILGAIWLLGLGGLPPIERASLEKYSPENLQRLLFSEWARLLAWTARVLILIVIALI